MGKWSAGRRTSGLAGKQAVDCVDRCVGKLSESFEMSKETLKRIWEALKSPQNLWTEIRSFSQDLGARPSKQLRRNFSNYETHVG